MTPKVTVEFLGGTADGEHLTGSCTLLTYREGKSTVRILIDLGISNFIPKDSSDINTSMLSKINAKYIDAALLTHGHSDHGSLVPAIVKDGFSGPIFCTKATAEVLPLMWADSARIQSVLVRTKKTKIEKVPRERIKLSRDQMMLGNYDKLKKKNSFRKSEKSTPLYEIEDVWQACDLIKNDGFVYGKFFKLCHHNLQVKFYHSGHVLGGAICVIRIKTEEGFFHLGFGGDLGRKDAIIMSGPELVEEPLDYWFSESTYGGRVHANPAEEKEQIIDLIREAKANNAKILIPALAFHRFQEILYLLSEFMSSGEAPKLPIYTHSRLALKLTAIYASSWKAGKFRKKANLPFNPFCDEDNKLLRVVSDKFEMERPIFAQEAMIILSSSGMCNAGPVRSYLKCLLGNPKVTVCLVSYMAQDTLGRKLEDGWSVVNINKEAIYVRARVIAFKSFSAHADGEELVDFAKQLILKNQTRYTRVFITHGTQQSSADLKSGLIKELADASYPEEYIIIPKSGEKYQLNLQHKY